MKTIGFIERFRDNTQKIDKDKLTYINLTVSGYVGIGNNFSRLMII